MMSETASRYGKSIGIATHTRRSWVFLLFSLLFQHTLSVPYPAGPVPIVPGTPTYDLKCLPYTPPPGLELGDPDSCEGLLQTGIRAMTSGPDVPFLFTQDRSRAPQRYGAIPFSLYSDLTPGLRSNTSIHELRSSSPITNNTLNSTNADDRSSCFITFQFAEGTSSSHEESWHTRLLMQPAITAWGNCMKYPPSWAAAYYAVIRPRPRSEVLKLEIRIETYRNAVGKAVA